jgi:predicted enzyme related to lactoylglutathione lyase
MKLLTAMIFAKDMDRMMTFYRDAIGLAFLPAQSSEGWAVFDAGGGGAVTLALHAIPAAIAGQIEIADPPEARSESAKKLIFAAADLEQARAQLAAHGAVILEPRRARSFDALDPEGNVFGVTQA